MATATRPRPETTAPTPPAPQPPATRVRFTAADSYRMVEMGILRDDSRVELIDGDLIAMCPIGPRHADEVDRLVELLVPRLTGRATVRVQYPLRLDEHSEPLPDLMIVGRREGGYASAHPGPADVLLLIEVMDTSAAYDRGTKLDLYARFSVAEVWLIDLNEHRVEMHRAPRAGTYTERLLRGPGQKVAPASLPDIELDVDAILG